MPKLKRKKLSDCVALIQGDCFEQLSLLTPKSVDLVVTDPPYWHSKSHTYKTYENTKSRMAKSDLYKFEGEMMGDLNDFDGECINTFLSKVVPCMKRMNVYAFCSEKQLYYYLKWAEENNYYSTVLVWQKPLSVMNKNRWSQNIEFIVRVYEHGTGLRSLDDAQLYNRVHTTKPVHSSKRLHPTEKPIELLENLIKLNSDEGDAVLDPFMGSGSTGVACKNLGRRFIGIEKTSKYYQVAIERL